MATYYRNRETGRVQVHPKAGLGDTFNADEIGEDGKPVKPRTSLAPSGAELKAAKELLRDQSAGASGPTKTTGNSAGNSK